MQDTIAAVATGAGVGAVGIVRISGARALEIGAAVVGLDVEKLDRTVRLAVVRGVDGERIDEVLVFAMRGPRSFTGEDVVELQGHGGNVNMARLLRAVLERGARPAQAGEFSRRAFENGKLDLLRAEGLLGVIEAGSERAWRLAQAQLGGALGRRTATLEERAVAVLAEIEGAIDFPDDDLEEQEAQWLRTELTSLKSACEALVASYAAGAALRRGITVALVGSVNVGKSSLLNAFAGRERALVSEQPGTTRDYVEVTVEWDGVSVTLVDTAGWRRADDPLEQTGMELGRRRAEEADVVLAVNDGGGQWPDGARSVVYVRSKVDVESARFVEPRDGEGRPLAVISASAHTGAGLDEIRRAVLERVGLAQVGGDSELLLTERQRALAANARDRFAEACARLDKYPRELIAYDVREGLGALFELRGSQAEEQVVDEIFARFCIGK